MFRVTVLILASLLFCPAQQPPAVTMDSVMTVQEMRLTGVGSLTTSQRAELDKWLTIVSKGVLEATPAGPSRAVENRVGT